MHSTFGVRTNLPWVLRTAVQWRKISFGNGSRNGEIATARLLTVTQTCKRQHRHVLGYLTDAVRSHRGKAAAPPLLPIGPDHLNCYKNGCALQWKAFSEAVYDARRSLGID